MLQRASQVIRASTRIFADGDGRSRILWITDMPPDELAPAIRKLVEWGATVMKRTLES